MQQVISYGDQDNRCSVIFHPAEENIVTIKQYAPLDIIDVEVTAEERADIEAFVAKGFYYGNLMMKVYKIINKKLTGD